MLAQRLQRWPSIVTTSDHSWCCYFSDESHDLSLCKERISECLILTLRPMTEAFIINTNWVYHSRGQAPIPRGNNQATVKNPVISSLISSYNHVYDMFYWQILYIHCYRFAHEFVVCKPMVVSFNREQFVWCSREVCYIIWGIFWWGFSGPMYPLSALRCQYMLKSWYFLAPAVTVGETKGAMDSTSVFFWPLLLPITL